MKLNYFESRALDLIMPYRYDDLESANWNQKQEYIVKSLNIFDYIILPIGLIMLKKRLRKMTENGEDTKQKRENA